MRLLKLMTLAAMMMTVLNAAAQNPKRANIWYFGINAGLDFTNGNPVALTNGAMQSTEGVTVACDAQGNLDFYSNGGDVPSTGAVWNRNHQVMPNGLLGHTGCASSIQSSLAVNLPGTSNIYYLFTTDCYENGLENGMAYSIIDMTLDGGLGDVVQRGVPLTGNTTESMTAVAHANQKEYWIVTHKVDTDSFYVYHLTREGITGVVKSKVGPYIDESAGEIKVSSNGERLVFAANGRGTGLYDFNPETGEITNYRDLSVPGGFTACFSPSCEFLYVSDFIGQKIYQFEMYALNIRATKTLIATPYNYVGSLQIGPDDKIYGAVRNSQYLAVITRPNIKGTDCNFVEQGQHLGGKASKYGLPNFPSNTLGECVPYPVENVSNYFPIRLDGIGLRSATLRWYALPGAQAYQIEIREAGADWQMVNTTSTVHTVEGLRENTEYEIRMHSVVYENGTYEFIHDHHYSDVVSGTENDHLLKAKTLQGLAFNLYPVPAKESVTVEINFEELSSAELVITDLSGKTIYTQNLESISGLQKIQIPTIELPNGSYQFSVRSNGRNENKHFIVMN